jgi:hypothetical protein
MKKQIPKLIKKILSAPADFVVGGIWKVATHKKIK